MKYLTFVAGVAASSLWVFPSLATAAVAPAPRDAVSDAGNSSPTAGHTPLHLAALRGDAEAVESLLAGGAEVNATNHFGATPLHYGIGSERIVAALLARGAQPNIVSQAGVTPIFGAVSQMDSIAVVRRLIEAGANVNLTRPDPGERAGSVLSHAILGGDRRTIALLLDPKIRMDPRHFGPALVTAALVGDLETARGLIERDANLNTMGDVAGTALNTALRSGNNQVAKLLIERGADLTLKSPRGYSTPPMVFSAYNDACDSSMAKLLIERGADINSANDIGETALTYALKNGSNTDLVRFLVASGGKTPVVSARTKAVPNREIPTDANARAAMARESSQRAIDLLQQSSNAFLDSGFVRTRGKCITCHHQSLPALAYSLARERGLRVDELSIGRQLVAKAEQRVRQYPRALEMITPVGGPPLALGHDAEELHALRVGSDEVTEAMTHYLLGAQNTDGSWSSPIRRVPMGDGAVVGTAWGIRAVQLYPPSERRAHAHSAVQRAREWLLAQRPPTSNERVFQLLGLAWADVSKDTMRPFAAALAKEQRVDGGWGQLPGIASDAWATGSALHALYKAGMPVTDPVYRRGADFLLRTQFDDGSWWVRSRAWPFQPHFDTGFPHGRDQWISAAGTAWAATALLLTLEPTIEPASLPDGRQLMVAFRKSSRTSESSAGLASAGSSRDVTTGSSLTGKESADSSANAIDFARDIQPLFKRSCAECHGGARPKGGFTVATREALLKGGVNGDAPIVPGHADQSHLLRYVSDQVEDLEMPPLNRREKYPALSSAEIARLRAWIDAGAPWTATKTAMEK